MLRFLFVSLAIHCGISQPKCHGCDNGIFRPDNSFAYKFNVKGTDGLCGVWKTIEHSHCRCVADSDCSDMSFLQRCPEQTIDGNQTLTVMNNATLNQFNSTMGLHVMCCSGECTDVTTNSDCGACGHECVIRNPFRRRNRLSNGNDTTTGACTSVSHQPSGPISALTAGDNVGYRCMYGNFSTPL
jgi:hypothetical protein